MAERSEFIRRPVLHGGEMVPAEFADQVCVMSWFNKDKASLVTRIHPEIESIQPILADKNNSSGTLELSFPSIRSRVYSNLQEDSKNSVFKQINEKIKSQEQVALLSLEEEVELGRRIRFGKSAMVQLKEGKDITEIEQEELQQRIRLADEAKELFAKANIRLVVDLVKKTNNGLLEYEERIGYGQLGLAEAIDRYDPESGNRFSTFATWLIRGQILSGQREKGRLIRIPDGKQTSIKNYRIEEELLKQIFGREVTTKEVLEHLNLDREDAQDLQAAFIEQPISLNTSGIVDGDTERLTNIVDETDIGTEDQALSKILLGEAFSVLSPKEIWILNDIFVSGKTWEEISGEYGVTRSRIGKISKNALAKMNQKISGEKTLLENTFGERIRFNLNETSELSQSDHFNTLLDREAFTTYLDKESKLGLSLTDQELDIYEQMCKGITNAEISSRLNLSRKVLEPKLTSIYEVLGIQNKLQAIKYALDSKHLDVSNAANYILSSKNVITLSSPELAVVKACMEDNENRQIARKLSKSDVTIHNNINSIFKKLGVSNKGQLLIYYSAMETLGITIESLHDSPYSDVKLSIPNSLQELFLPPEKEVSIPEIQAIVLYKLQEGKTRADIASELLVHIRTIDYQIKAIKDKGLFYSKSEKSLLTQKQVEVLTRLNEGKSDSEIADELQISEDSVKYRTRNLLGNLQVDSISEAIHVAKAKGIIVDTNISEQEIAEEITPVQNDNVLFFTDGKHLKRQIEARENEIKNPAYSAFLVENYMSLQTIIHQLSPNQFEARVLFYNICEKFKAGEFVDLPIHEKDRFSYLLRVAAAEVDFITYQKEPVPVRMTAWGKAGKWDTKRGESSHETPVFIGPRLFDGYSMNHRVAATEVNK